MRKLALQMQVSVDGFVAGPNGELDWVFRSLGDDATAWIVERLWQAGVHIMGRRTYHDMAAHWPTSTEPYAAPMNQIPKVVFSRKGVLEPAGAATARALEDASRNREARGGRSASAVSSVVEEWARSRVAGGELAEEIARLKRESARSSWHMVARRLPRAWRSPVWSMNTGWSCIPSRWGGGCRCFRACPGHSTCNS
jgi:hypothetical protein